MRWAKTQGARSIVAYVFVSPSEPRLRAGWRLILQSILMVALMVACLAPVIVINLAQDRDLLQSETFAAGQVAELLAVLLSIVVARRVLDKRSFSELGLVLGRRMWLDLALGIGISFVMMAVILAVHLATGWMTIEAVAWQTDQTREFLAGMLGWLAIFVLVGWNEELLFRGYQMQTIASGVGLRWGMIVSSVLFAAAHLGNPNADSVIMVVLGLVLAGLLMAYAYVRTRSLWLPIGLHIGWNYTEGVIFGFPVSGLSTYQLLHVSVRGPSLWTGGAFGPEAGLVLLPSIALGFLLIHLYAKPTAR